jgi:hypothetical protein
VLYRNRLRFLSSFVLLVGTLTSGVARGGFLTTLQVTVIETTSGSYQYNYTIDNTSASTLPAVEFTLSVDPAANLQSPFGPSNWIITYDPGNQVIDWASPSSADGVLAGESATFGFTSALPPLTQSYSVLGINDTTGDVGFTVGMILSPGSSSVPEPSSLALLVMGALPSMGRWASRYFLRLRLSKY